MGTLQIDFKHDEKLLTKACAIQEHNPFVIQLLEELTIALQEDEAYLHSNAIEDIIKRTRKYLGVDNASINIWTDDILSVYIAYRLGCILTELEIRKGGR